MSIANLNQHKSTVTGSALAGQALFDCTSELGRDFARRAADLDAGDRFAADNFAALKAARVLSAGVPLELGGGGASYRDLADCLRELGRHCSGTALALAMHMHPMAAAVWRWQHEKAPVDGLLKRIASEQLMLLSTGGNDWLNGSGEAKAVEGGFRISGRKRFVSGAEAGDLLMTMAVTGDTVLHAAIPMRSEGLRIERTWQTLGMRASGSQDVVLENVFVPEAAIAVRRTAGQWHPFFHLVTKIAFPLIYSVYRGVAERLQQEVIDMAVKRRADADTQLQIGALGAAMAGMAAAHDALLELGDNARPAPATSAQVLTLKRVMTQHLLDAASLALDAAGGSAFYRANRIERLFRDLQAARYHPFTQLPQQRLAGRLALGLDADGRDAA
ncbi:acyl-CoA dehydrogenase family protein [Ferrovibrio sp. MS7]|uniref:acyl-CoA dehydrogenase family protein n=1 Tax=Ferrovibrio plantarum TaxID=3119164 RepID=UPI003134663C